MNAKHLFIFLASVQLPVFASPGDDIWDHIRYLKHGLGLATIEINALKDRTTQLQAQLDAHTTQLQSQIDIQNKQIQQILQKMEVLKSNQVKRHSIGERYHGGIIFYVDDSGQHGLIASIKDTGGIGVQWRNGDSGNKITNAKGDGIGAGATNTRLIISQQTIYDTKGKFAALQASQFQVMEDGVTPCKTPIATAHVCYSGWYLPSAYELQLMHQNLHENNLSSFAPEFYWSSTEASISNAWLVNFSSGEITASSKSNTVGRVRAVSQF
ncbi:DUF1566 domain-containing protein [Legionella lytica]|uniref:DUF1566 domain-containing protein n=1 Tax=Legionella lytica TaxID=96232 RepID=A0ABW8DDF0_9GAMM